jgi:O-antigen/teichoic acid export membrane protein
MSGNVVVMTGRPRLNLVNGLTEGILNVLLNLWLIPKFGLMGAAGASSIAAVARATLEVTEVYKLIGVRFIPRVVVAPLAAGLAVVVVVLLVSATTDLWGNLVGRIGLTLAAAGAFFAIVYAATDRSDKSISAGSH